MKLVVEDRVFDAPTETVIASALAILPKEGGIAVLENAGDFLQTRRHGDLFEVEYREADTLFDTAERLSVSGVTELFQAYVRRAEAWNRGIRWGISSAAIESEESLHRSVLDAAGSYEAPELAAVRARLELLRKGDEVPASGPIRDWRDVPDEACCRRCGSTQLVGGQKGYGAGKGIAGLLVAGPVGLLAGLIGRKKVVVSCLNCGHSWRADSWLK